MRPTGTGCQVGIYTFLDLFKNKLDYDKKKLIACLSRWLLFG
jgi:hypothetical protein